MQEGHQKIYMMDNIFIYFFFFFTLMYMLTIVHGSPPCGRPVKGGGALHAASLSFQRSTTHPLTRPQSYRGGSEQSKNTTVKPCFYCKHYFYFYMKKNSNNQHSPVVMCVVLHDSILYKMKSLNVVVFSLLWIQCCAILYDVVMVIG